jgi:hypothetical protein
MRLPHGDLAEVDLRKLSEYCLNPDHLRGKHKARVFATVLGMTAADASELRQLLLLAAESNNCVFSRADQFGNRYVVDFDVARGAWSGRVRSVWMVRHGELSPRLTTCFVLK